MSDVVTWIALFAAVAAFGSVLRLWQLFADRVAEANAQAKSASEDAKEVKQKISDLETSHVAGVAAFAIYREQIAREYITRDIMREFEQRVSDAARENADRLSGEIKEISKRIDGVLFAIAPKKAVR